MPRKPGKPKESIIDWMNRTNAELAAKRAQQPLTSPPTPTSARKAANLSHEQIAKHPKYVPLTIWAQLMFGEYSPHVNTLRRWVNDGRIQPQPKKMGRYWFVRVDAEYTPD
jgi:hypothetical protein